jgi:hypothetical protein
MSVYLGVSRTLAFLEDEPGTKNFWCVSSKSQPTQPGDLLLLYFPVGVSRVLNGIGQVYQITSLPQGGKHSECGDRSMSSIDTELLLNLTEHIRVKDMKRNKIVRQWGALSRNFQGVTFAVPDLIWNALYTMILNQNPEVEEVLGPLTKIQNVSAKLKA